MTQLAIIKTGGKQYLVTPGQTIKIEKISKSALAETSASAPASTPASAEALAGKKAVADEKATAGKLTDKKEGQEIVFDQVLLLQKDKTLEIGAPLVKKARVIGRLKKEGKGKKVIIFKQKPKKRYKVKKGHRQPYIEVEILVISN